MANQFPQPNFKVKTSVLVFGKGWAAPLVLYFENPEEKEDILLIFRLLSKDLAAETFVEMDSDKQELLIKHGIALWDVLSSCEREGSLDSNIMNEIPNDIKGLLVQYPTIEYIIFNGGKAYQSFKKYFPELLVQKQWIKMPSTSPAYTLKREEKRKKWRKILDICEINL